MAGLWIRVEHVTPDKPEVHRMAEILDIDADMVLGKLVRLWVWADQQTISGCAPSVTKTLLDRVTVLRGFADALIAVGWLIETPGGVEFPNFQRLNGEGSKQRALASNRMAKKRSKLNENVTLPAQQKKNNSVTREEKNREEEDKEPPLPPEGGAASPRTVKLPPELSTAEFKLAWLEWIRHRNEIKKPLKPTQAAKQIAQFAKWGASRSIAAIEFTITMGWQGIKEPPNDSGTGSPRGNYRQGNSGVAARQDALDEQMRIIADFAAGDDEIEPAAVRRLDGSVVSPEAYRRLE